MQSHDGFIYLLPALPAQWKEGSVNGIIARGGFELDLSWKNGKVSRLVVKSRNGGNCRLRSLNPLAGKGLRKAKGENPNKLYAIPEILQPIINKEAKLNKVELKKTYLYDLETKAGEEYSEFKQINILKKEGKMDGQLKVAAVQVTVEQNNIKKNMENVEKMAMSQQNRCS